jgi:hypothetical protein
MLPLGIIVVTKRVDRSGVRNVNYHPKHGSRSVTIAVCYLSPEGLVFGADSTASALLPSAPGTVAYHYYNHNQKVFQIGENSTLGIVTWGMSGLGTTSHRTLVARLADSLQATKPKKVVDVANQWAALFWKAYSAQYQNELKTYLTLKAKTPLDPSATTPNPAARSKAEEDLFQAFSRELVVGFCLGGYCLPQRDPEAFMVTFEPSLSSIPTPVAVQVGSIQWFGVPNLILRLINGYDSNLVQAILTSHKWTGTQQELTALLDQHRLSHGLLPIRDAIDFVYTSIYSTIKAMKFSSLSQICGGPIELAVITTDREFRWVRHKAWDSAINEG